MQAASTPPQNQPRPDERVLIRSMLDIETFESVAIESRLAGALSTYDVLRESAKRHPDAIALTALVEGGGAEVERRLTYSDLMRNVNRAANAFVQLGIGSEDVISYLLPNLPETHYTFWGGEAAGIVNPINWYLEPVQIAEIMNAAGTKVLVAAGSARFPDVWEKVRAVRPLVPTLRAVIQVGQGGSPDGALDFAELLAAQPDDRLISGRIIRGGDIAAYFHTGGTTGAPKLASHTHFNEVVDGLMAKTALDLTRDDTLLCGLPMFHVNAMVITGIASFMAASQVVLVGSTGYRNKTAVKSFWKIVESTKASAFSAVPSVYSSLLNEPIGDHRVGSLRYGLCGAAPMSVELFRRFEATTGIKILEAYGLTESTCLSTANPRDGERKIGSIGLRAPYQRMKAAILDENMQFVRDCAVDEVGSLLIQGPNVFPGYKQEAHNKNVWAAPGWLNTGDLGRQDADGYFWLAGRLKELIIRGGHNIDPAIIEEAMLAHPFVNGAAAVGKPDAYAGELPVVFVTLKPGAVVDAAALLDHARRAVPERAAVPVEVFVLDGLPLTAVGKIFKPQLRYDATRFVFEKVARECCGDRVQYQVQVGPHPKTGTAAIVSLEGSADTDREEIERVLGEALAAFHVPCTIQWR
ncbi:MAG: AMP-binding protein [Nevskia sp.]|nr:AMP-binding protein [Nevskia sp.]